METIFKCAGMPSGGGVFHTEHVQKMIKDTEERGFTITDKVVIPQHDVTSPRVCIFAQK